jgi:hypothetical protein
MDGYPAYLQAASRRPKWLRVDRLLGQWGIARDSAAGRKQWAWQMERRRQEESRSGYQTVRRGWCFGSEEFRQEFKMDSPTTAHEQLDPCLEPVACKITTLNQCQ